MTAIAPTLPEDETVDRTTVFWCGVMLLGAIVLQRFGLRIGQSAIPFTLPLTLIALTALAVTGRVALSPSRLILFLAFAAYMLLDVGMGVSDFSMPSLGYVLITYAGYVLTSKVNLRTWRAILNVFQVAMAICAILGLMQFLGQKIAPGAFWFTFEGMVPKTFLLPNYNTLIPIYFQASIYKSNGFFLVEPSTFSQFLAIAIVIELAVFGWSKRLLLYFAAFPFAYSGTGLILLSVVMPFLLFHQRAVLPLLGAAAALAFVLVTDSIDLGVFISRAAEVTSTQSSGFARFVGPAWMLSEEIFPHADRLIWGMGPGTIQDYVAYRGYLAVDPTWAKLLFEYGLVGTILFTAFALKAMLTDSRSKLVALALLVCYLMLGGRFLSAYMHALILALVALHPAPAALLAARPLPEGKLVPLRIPLMF